MYAIRDIIDFSCSASQHVLEKLISLFHDKHFRNLYAFGLHLYWSADLSIFDKKSLDVFDGRLEIKQIFNKHIEELSNSNSSKQQELINQIRCLKLFHLFEKDVYSESSEFKDAKNYREKAFQLLDWLPSILGISNRKTVVNIFLQIGIKFQQASLVETTPYIKMADEQLSLKVYMMAVSFGMEDSGPDVEMYISTEVLKYLSVFSYNNDSLKVIMPALQKRALMLGDIFPFFHGPCSNISFHQKENKYLELMRKSLNVLINIINAYKTKDEPLPIEYSKSTILYQVYDACITNWYQDYYNPDFEKKLRLDLMEELLYEKNWDFMDVELNVDAPWIMVNRSKEGWMVPSSIPHEESNIYRLIKGAEINSKTGEITFLLESWERGRPEYEKLFSQPDLEQMLAKNLYGAIFSLDPVDADKSYHPFNAMRIGPSQLADSELLNTMLLTDYMLKFLTTGFEVQGEYPYDIKPINQMIEHLPQYLRQIITDFQSSKKNRSAKKLMHRFWITSEEANVLNSAKDDIQKISLSNIRMVVKKHRLELDVNGNIQDTSSESEGWPIYILSESQFKELRAGSRKIKSQAIIFIEGFSQLFFWGKNKIILDYQPQKYNETLGKLYSQPKDEAGKVILSSKNEDFIYRVITKVAANTNMDHEFSPEYIFAHEFTKHYDEFAQYFPEFGRLKELSKITVLINIFNARRESNKKQIEQLKSQLEIDEFTASKKEIFESYNSYYLREKNETQKTFLSLSEKLLLPFIQNDVERRLNEAQRQINDQIHISLDSDEVVEAYEKEIQEKLKINPRTTKTNISKAVSKEAIAGDLSARKKDYWIKTLISDKYKLELSCCSEKDAIHFIEEFLRGNSEPLIYYISKYERQEQIKNLKDKLLEKFSESTEDEIESALVGNSSSIEEIFKKYILYKLQKILETKKEIASHNASCESTNQHIEILSFLIRFNHLFHDDDTIEIYKIPSMESIKKDLKGKLNKIGEGIKCFHPTLGFHPSIESQEFKDFYEENIKLNLKNNRAFTRRDIISRMPKERELERYTRLMKEDLTKKLVEIFLPMLPNYRRKDIIGFVEKFLSGSSELLINHLSKCESRKHVEFLITELESKEKIEKSFAKMGLGADSEPVELKERCMWVPASIGRKDRAPGVMSFVYGGVSISPKINVTHTANGSSYSDQNNSRVTINTSGSNRGSCGSAPVGQGGSGDDGPGEDKSKNNSSHMAGDTGLQAYSMSNLEVRKWYHSQLDRIPSLIDNTLSLKEQGLQAFTLRNKFKMQARELMKDRALADTLPDPKTLKKSVCEAYKKHGLVGDNIWERMLVSSQRSNAGVDKKVGLSRNE